MLPFFKKAEKEIKTRRHWPLYLVAVFFILADLAAFSYLIFEEYYKDKIYPGVSVGEINLGGKTAEEAKKIINEKIDAINQDGFTFNFEGKNTTITPIISSFNGDIALQIININPDDTVSKAFGIGRKNGAYYNLLAQLRALSEGWQVSPAFSVDNDRVEDILANSFNQLAAAPENANIFATSTLLFGKKIISIGIIPEKIGYNLDYASALRKLENNLELLDNQPITLTAAKGYPDVRKGDIAPLRAAAQEFLDDASLTLVYGKNKWPVAEDQFASWLTIERTANSSTALSLDKEKIRSYLNQKAAPEIEIPPADARFEIKDGRVVQFNKSQNGKKIDIDQTYQNLRNDFLAQKKDIVTIAMATVTGEMATEQTKNLGITEIIGTGHSNFSGSPKNRIININVGAASLNGLLIPPGTEFSTDKSLGTVDASTGYLPEMSIMGDKTVAEYGGGLCQIGTTLFRAALASGFPITARQAHSYRVMYYEPAGTDATIYQPWPDLRFINDTKNYILIQTHISGNDLYFDFWGTKDGRIVEQTDPSIYNIVKPQPTLYTETLSLPPGQKKCTERAHNGADAFFDYKVTYPDGTVKQKRFTSHYVPWREVCLIGVDKLSATSTPAVIK
jgi:vancomycin resistance protein YoaR